MRLTGFGRKAVENVASLPLIVDGEKYKVKIRKIDLGGPSYHLHENEVHIMVPAAMNVEEVARIESNFRKRAEKEIIELQKKLPPKTYANGQKTEAWGKEYTVMIEYKHKSSSSAKLFGESTILLSISSSMQKHEQDRTISSLLTACIAQDMLPALQKMMNELNEKHFGIAVGEVSFNHRLSKASRAYVNGDIMVSPKLLAAQKDMAEFMCLWALYSLAEHREPGKFHSILEKAMPNHLEKKEWLDNNFSHLGF